jgi:hypothetical protein
MVFLFAEDLLEVLLLLELCRLGVWPSNPPYPARAAPELLDLAEVAIKGALSFTTSSSS